MPMIGVKDVDYKQWFPSSMPWGGAIGAAKYNLARVPLIKKGWKTLLDSWIKVYSCCHLWSLKYNFGISFCSEVLKTKENLWSLSNLCPNEDNKRFCLFPRPFNNTKKGRLAVCVYSLKSRNIWSSKHLFSGFLNIRNHSAGPKLCLVQRSQTQIREKHEEKCSLDHSVKKMSSRTSNN